MIYEYDHGGQQLLQMVGANVTGVAWSDSLLTFLTDRGVFSFRVEGECCSACYFNDIIGVAKLLANGPVVSVDEIELSDRNSSDGETKFYGYELVTEHPLWGEQTTVFSFRNESNGYYGGSLLAAGPTLEKTQTLLLEDVVTS